MIPISAIRSRVSSIVIVATTFFSAFELVASTALENET
jgi:hypothetical protein